MQTIKMIKSDALIPISIGSAFFQKLLNVLMNLADQHTEEEMKIFKELIDTGTELPEPWMENIYTLMILVRDIEKSADDHGFSYEQSIDDITKQ